MPELTIDAVRHALSFVEEPDLGQDLITLNIVEDIRVEGPVVSFSTLCVEVKPPPEVPSLLVLPRNRLEIMPPRVPLGWLSLMREIRLKVNTRFLRG